MSWFFVRSNILIVALILSLGTSASAFDPDMAAARCITFLGRRVGLRVLPNYGKRKSYHAFRARLALANCKSVKALCGVVDSVLGQHGSKLDATDFTDFVSAALGRVWQLGDGDLNGAAHVAVQVQKFSEEVELSPGEKREILEKVGRVLASYPFTLGGRLQLESLVKFDSLGRLPKGNEGRLYFDNDVFDGFRDLQGKYFSFSGTGYEWNSRELRTPFPLELYSIPNQGIHSIYFLGAKDIRHWRSSVLDRMSRLGVELVRDSEASYTAKVFRLEGHRDLLRKEELMKLGIDRPREMTRHAKGNFAIDLATANETLIRYRGEDANVHFFNDLKIEWGLQKHAVTAIGKRRFEEGRAELRAFLQTSEGWPRGRDERAKVAAVTLLQLLQKFYYWDF